LIALDVEEQHRTLFAGTGHLFVPLVRGMDRPLSVVREEYSSVPFSALKTAAAEFGVPSCPAQTACSPLLYVREVRPEVPPCVKEQHRTPFAETGHLFVPLVRGMDRPPSVVREESPSVPSSALKTAAAEFVVSPCPAQTACSALLYVRGVKPEVPPRVKEQHRTLVVETGHLFVPLVRGMHRPLSLEQVFYPLLLFVPEVAPAQVS